MTMRVAANAVLSLTVALLAACGATSDGTKGEIIYLVDGETALVDVSAVECAEGAPQISINGELSSKGDPGFVDIQVEIDGVVVGALQVVTPSDFVFVGDRLGATLSAEIPLPYGEHTFRLCLIERDLEGVIGGQACLPPREYSRDCGLEEDETNPSISAQARREPNENGWYREPVTIQFSCSDEESGVASCSADATLGAEGGSLKVHGYAVDFAGNSAGATNTEVRIDWTPPVISFIGARDYLVDERVEAACSISDALSGIHESTCTGNSGEAYMFDLGTYPIEAYGVDLAGNEASASGEFSVSATASSVCNIVKRFVQSREHQASLCGKLLSAENAFSGQDAEAGNAELEAFHAEIDDEMDLTIPAEHAGTLLRLSVGLRPN